MSKQHGTTLTKFISSLSLCICIFFSNSTFAIYIGDLTFTIDSDKTFVGKRILNNNKTAKIYRIALSGINSPVGNEVGYSPADGEVLFAPHILTLQPGSGDYFKFFYHGPDDGKERYYRVSFSEIPIEEYHRSGSTGGSINLEPIVVLDSILVVRPRQPTFSWRLIKNQGVLKNTGNTFFKLIVKPDCHSTEEQGKEWYLRPGDSVSTPLLQQDGDKYIVYNYKYINISHDCEQ